VGPFEQLSAEEWELLARCLDARIDDLSGEQEAVAVRRASQRIGIADLDAQDEQHLRVLWDELRAAALRASLDRLVRKRELVVDGVADCGHLIYAPPTPDPG
jgi:hypothetical protein